MTHGPGKIRETLGEDTERLLGDVWEINRATVQERVKKAFKPFVDRLTDPKGILPQCMDKMMAKAAATYGNTRNAESVTAGPSAVSVLEEYAAVFDAWLQETGTKLPVIREMSLLDDVEGMAVVTRHPPPPPPLAPQPSLEDEPPPVQYEERKRRLLKLIAANRFPMPLDLRRLPVYARPMTLPTAWILQRMNDDERHGRLLEMITELKPVPATPADGVNQLAKELFPHKFRPGRLTSTGPDNMLVALATQIIGLQILAKADAQTNTVVSSSGRHMQHSVCTFAIDCCRLV